MDEHEAVVLPESLTALSVDDLTALETRAVREFDLLAANDDIDEDGVSRLEVLAAGIEALRAEIGRQGTEVAAATQRLTRRDQARGRVGAQPDAPVADEEPDAGDADAGDVTAPVAAGRRPRASLQAAQERAPRQLESPDLAITAASPTAGLAIGTQFRDMDHLVEAFSSHARGMVTSHGQPGFLTVASLRNEFDHTVHGERTTPAEFEQMMDAIRTEDAVESVVAGGGWCAPSETRYDFFNIACEDGAVDLPTFGVQRGGIRFPVSPSLADVFTGTFTNATNPWLWQEIDDIATVTGAPNKPCVRVTCPTFDDRRLECYGICLTAGNLTDSAYPEATRNHLSLLMSAHYHAMNQRYLAVMELLSTAVITGAPTNGTSILSDAPATAGLAAQDIRTRFGMCDTDVIEVVYPRWVRDAMRDDHLRRTGFWETPLTNAQIDGLFRARRVRPQWVADWQVRATGQPGASTAITDWPSTVRFMAYPAGTFVRGNGMTLDLGVVRDSVLNAENDHTAGWTEECHLIARYGHESRLYQIPVCTAGRTGIANVTCTDT